MSQKARPWRRLYNTAAWRELRGAHLLKEPLCRACLRVGLANDGSFRPGGDVQTNKARRFLVVDHKIAHKGDVALFYDPDNLQTMCPDHHDRAKQREEARGWSEERGLDGWPIDPRHPANR